MFGFVIGHIAEIIASFIDVIFLAWFVPRYNKVKNGIKALPIIVLVLLFAFELVGDKFLAGFDYLYAVIFFILSMAFAYIVCNGFTLRATVASWVYAIVPMLTNSLVYMVFGIFFDSIDTILQGNLSVGRIIYLVVCKIVQFSIYLLILHVFKSTGGLDRKNGFLVFVFTIVTAFGTGLIMNLATTDISQSIEFTAFILVFVLVFTNFALHFLIYQIQKLLKHQYEMKLISEKMEFERSRSEEVGVIWDKIKKVRHDMKNHLSMISGYLETGDTDTCLKYIGEIHHTVSSMGELIRSNNTTIDYLINSKLSCLNDVQILISGNVGNYRDISDVDMACIVGNILDNAIEAEERVTGEKRIELYFLEKNDNRIIVCKNSIDHSVLETNKELKSTKKSSTSHGLGHQIVENVVSSHGGWVDYFESDGMFGVQIILPIIK